jgi:hypothetical protein
MPIAFRHRLPGSASIFLFGDELGGHPLRTALRQAIEIKWMFGAAARFVARTARYGL